MDDENAAKLYPTMREGAGSSSRSRPAASGADTLAGKLYPDMVEREPPEPLRNRTEDRIAKVYTSMPRESQRNRPEPPPARVTREEPGDPAVAWEKALREDPEIGGERFDETLEVAREVVHEFGGDTLIDVLNETRVGSHPEVVRAFARVGQALRKARGK